MSKFILFESAASAPRPWTLALCYVPPSTWQRHLHLHQGCILTWAEQRREPAGTHLAAHCPLAWWPETPSPQLHLSASSLLINNSANSQLPCFRQTHGHLLKHSQESFPAGKANIYICCSLRGSGYDQRLKQDLAERADLLKWINKALWSKLVQSK